MCGIAGMLAADPGAAPDEGAVRRMCDAMVHRGPDDHGYRADGPCALGHRRLSIIDLRPEGAQPMTNEDGSVVIVFNGEVYNFRELRADLERQGHVFASQSDTEAVLHAYEQYGDQALERLNGMFAFALYDKTRNRLLIARDRLGIKPLFYVECQGGLFFASELEALLRSGCDAVIAGVGG